LVALRAESLRLPGAQEAGVNKATQGSVHSAFYNGYTLTQARRPPFTLRCTTRI
jgi:hypothetical protein